MDLQVGTGVVEYNLNGNVAVHFNPSDAAFVENLMNVFDKLEIKHNEYRATLRTESDPKRVFEIARALDADMRSMLDSIFDVPVCGALFGSMNVYAMADGLPAWANLLLAVLDVCAETFKDADDKMNERILKYTAKYDKYRANRRGMNSK